MGKPRILLLILVISFVVLVLTTPVFGQAESFTFTTVGDLGSTANTDSVLNGIAASGAAFHLTLGDLSYGTNGAEAVWCNYVQGKVGATFPFELVSGNHDADGSVNGHIDNFSACLPDRIGNLTGTYGKEYYFDYQNLARVIFIAPNLTLNGQSYAYTVGNAHYNWLVSAIDGARAANIPWVIVGMHKNCISTGVKSCEIGTDLFNLLINKKVDLVLQGHDHNYQRSKQLAFNGTTCTSILPGAYEATCVVDDGADNSYSKNAGMVLAVVGTGGQSLYGSNPADAEAGYFSRIVLPGDTARYGFLKVTLTSSQLNAQFVPTTAGTFTDSFSIIGAAPSPTPTFTNTPTATFTNSPSATVTSTSTAIATKTSTATATKTSTVTVTKTSTATATKTATKVSTKTPTRTPTKTLTRTNTPQPGAWIFCANQNGVCTVPGTRVVRFGANGLFKYKMITGSVTCVPANFGGDPIVGVAKQCHYTTAGVPLPTATATRTPTRTRTRTPTKTASLAPIAGLEARVVQSTRVSVEWQTTDETLLNGFNVWRRPRGTQTWEQANARLIAAQTQGQPSGNKYVWRDRNTSARTTYFYKLQILYADDSVQWSDTLKVKVP